MIGEATSQNRELGFDRSAGIHRRQVWRPAGLLGVESILSGIANRNKPFDDHRARLTAWYEQLVQRSQPFIGWQPLAKAEMEADDIQSSFGSARAEERILRSESPMISKEPPPFARPVSVAQDQPSAAYLSRSPGEQQRPQNPSILRRSISEPIHTAAKSMLPSGPLAADLSAPAERSMRATDQPTTPIARGETADDPAVPTHSAEVRQLPGKDTPHATEPGSPLTAMTRRREEQALERPALRLAILRPINTAALTVQRKEMGSVSSATSGFSKAETNDLPGPEQSLVEEQSAFPPRLVSSVSSLRRQEVRGGFPVSVKAEARADADTPSDDLLGVPVRETSAFRNDGATESRSLVSSRPAEVAEPAAIPPMALPGVQIRLLKPDESASTTPSSGDRVAEGGRPAIDISKPKTPVPAAPPPLDINAVVDKVYQKLQRRFQLERERRGLY
jgi:hypothetical protein